MTDVPGRSHVAAVAPARVCKTTGCGLLIHGAHRLCESCAGVCAATFALYHRFVERDGARAEAETPGFVGAMRPWLTMPPRGPGGVLRPAVPSAAGLRRRLEDDAVLIGWQVDRLEKFVAELRVIALDSRVRR